VTATEAGANGRREQVSPNHYGVTAGSATTNHTAGATPMASVSEGLAPTQTEGTPISGHVLRADGTAIGHAALTLIDPAGHQVGRGLSTVDGDYRLAAPKAGTYVLIASAGAHQPQASVVPIGAHPVVLDVVLHGTGGLTGTVTSATAPLVGATATLADDRGEVIGARSTDEQGRYSFAELLTGNYTLVVSALGYQPAAVAVSVPATGDCVQDVSLTGGSRLRGVASAVDGRVVPDARITLLDSSGAVIGATTTDEQGAYEFADLPEGDYTVIASGYPPVAAGLRVADGEQGRHDVQLGHPQA